MYNKLLSAIPVLLLALTLSVEAQPLTGKYPPVDKPPPPVASWTALVDQTKLPKAPVRAVGGACDPADPFCVWSCTTCTRPDTDVINCPNKNEWGLSYDDGPTNNTLRVLQALKDRGLKATFFVIGSRVYENPQILKQVVDAGHQIGIHTWSHTALTTQTTEEIIAETKWTEMAIKQAVNLTPKWFRAPTGDCDDRVRGILKQLGYKIAFWNHDTFDWMSNSDPTYDLNWIPQNFTIWVQNKTSPTGFASLEHDAFDKSSSMTSVAMDIVLKAQFKPQPLAVCTGDQQPYIENVEPAKSNIVGNATNAISATNATATNGTTKDTSHPSAVMSKSGSVSIEKNVQLSILCGFVMMIFGFVGTIYP